MPKEKKEMPSKGKRKTKPDTDNPDENPLLRVDNTDKFTIHTGNLLQDTSLILFNDFTPIDLKKDDNVFEINKLNDNSIIIISLRYYEYVCIAKFQMSFVVPILKSGLSMKDIFNMVKHCLKNKLIINAPTFDSIYDIDIVYNGYIKYNTDK